jgi:hypothetical protein
MLEWEKDDYCTDGVYYCFWTVLHPQEEKSCYRMFETDGAR